MGENEVKKCTVRKKIFALGRLKHPKKDKNLLFCNDEPNEPTNHVYSAEKVELYNNFYVAGSGSPSRAG
jgi:hypothetical protein